MRVARERKNRVGWNSTIPLVLQKRDHVLAPSCSHGGSVRREGWLSKIGWEHSGQRESAGRPVRMYPHPSHKSAPSSGIADAARDIGLWYTRGRSKSVQPWT